MANYPTLFSFAVTDLTDAQRTWLEALLATDEEGLPSAELRPLLADETPGFAAQFEDDGRTLWVHSEDGGTPADAANVVQQFLARFRPEDSLGFEWANTCSRPIIDAFGGGAVFITATHQRWNNSSTWLAEQLDTPGSDDYWKTDADLSADWKHEVANGDTLLGYHAWAAKRAEERLEADLLDGDAQCL